LIPVDSSTYGSYPTDTGIVIFNTVSANGGEPGGSNLSVQFNSGADFAGDAVFLYDYTNKNLTLGNATTVANIYANSGTISANTVNANFFTGLIATASNLTVTGNSNLGSNANVFISGGNDTQVLTTDGLGNLYWSNGGSGTSSVVGSYVHTQGTSSATWTVVHNLNTDYVDVHPIFSNSYSMVGAYDFPTVTYVNANAVTLTFSSAVTGYVAVSGDQGNSDGYYTESISSASTTWTVNHNLGSQFAGVPLIQTDDTSYYGRYDYPTVTYTNDNSLTISFDTAQSGNVAVVGSSNISGYYLHNQSSASTTWVITHNLNQKYLNVTPIDSSNVSYVGRYDFPSIYYNNSNALTLLFSSAVTGNAVIVGGGGSANPAGGSNTEVQFNNGGSLDGDTVFTYNTTTNILSVPVITLSVVTFSNLPAATIAGRKAFVSDSNLVSSGNFGAIISGGGSNTVPVYSDGTNWRIG